MTDGCGTVRPALALWFTHGEQFLHVVAMEENVAGKGMAGPKAHDHRSIGTVFGEQEISQPAEKLSSVE
ncbi:MAG: hypothetical protein A3H25_07280 [Sphingomonadales bacterium RIFCSPLOWO2_12_FULL_63_15]|nr:MAG: hypothetical protein A3H25_07280 [Sphingomonadales bacterium RIFCSPLOWO2_12_FULL_63_15]